MLLAIDKTRTTAIHGRICPCVCVCACVRACVCVRVYEREREGEGERERERERAFARCPWSSESLNRPVPVPGVTPARDPSRAVSAPSGLSDPPLTCPAWPSLGASTSDGSCCTQRASSPTWALPPPQPSATYSSSAGTDTRPPGANIWSRMRMQTPAVSLWWTAPALGSCPTWQPECCSSLASSW